MGDGFPDPRQWRVHAFTPQISHVLLCARTTVYRGTSTGLCIRLLPEGRLPRRNTRRGNGVSGPPGASQIHSLGSLAREPCRGGSQDRVAGRERLPVLLLVWKLEVSVCSVSPGLRSHGTAQLHPSPRRSRAPCVQGELSSACGRRQAMVSGQTQPVGGGTSLPCGDVGRPHAVPGPLLSPPGRPQPRKPVNPQGEGVPAGLQGKRRRTDLDTLQAAHSRGCSGLPLSVVGAAAHRTQCGLAFKPGLRETVYLPLSRPNISVAL